MALGFGFNKQKVLASAEKAVQQGKIQNAITEYEKITKEDPKDLTVLNTIGDLYARVGQNDKAGHYFKRVGDLYAGEGFTVKAIAMYKKLTKLTPGNAEATLKLAELYTQQGLYNDAKAQYVVLADQSLKSSDMDSAARSFQKILELDPENTAMQSKLADTYMKLGKKAEARGIFFTAAQSLYQRGALDAADESLRRVLQMEPTNLDALLLQGKIAADSGDGAAAIAILEKVPDIDSRPDALKALLRSHILLGHTAQAEPVAAKLLTVHNDLTGVKMYAESLMTAGSYPEALATYSKYADKFLAANSKELIETLHGTIGRIKDSAPALEHLLQLYKKAGETINQNEAMELLAHAYVQDDKLQAAADLYKELSAIEPENPLHAQNHKQIISRLGQDPAARPLSHEEASQALMVDELEHTGPTIEQKYPDDLGDDIRAAITDSELFDSYNLPAKAISPLEAVYPKAPRDIQLNQRLASLYARAGRFDEAAKCCEVLQGVYSEAGHAEPAKQYSEMAAKYRERHGEPAATAAPTYETPAPVSTYEMPVAATASPAEAAPAEHSMADFSFDSYTDTAAAAAPAAPAPQEFVMDASAAAAPVEAAAPTAESAHEIDLSSEWEGMTDTPAAAAPAQSESEVADEVKFYLGQSMWAEAAQAITKLEGIAPGSAMLAGLRAQLEAGRAPAPTAAAESSVAEFSFDVEAPAPVAPPPPPPPAPKAAPAPAKVAAPPPPPKPAPAPAPVAAAKDDLLGDFVLDLEDSLGDDFAFSGKPGEKPAPAPAKAAAAAAAPAPAPKPKPVPPPLVAAPLPSPIQGAEAHSVLSDLFDEFKEDVEQTSSASDAEDPDTHYNLGVAFKEMGLLDEAIGELQKVCSAIEHGHPFSQVIQAYTWLASCFVEKGVPEAAVKWYERALKAPAVDEESKMAIYYELASAHESAGNKKAALTNFMEVYGTNIDYRDVADRIKALRT
ncbi:MAG: tetratricopeptide repeat protein [Terriglobales bacterium]|jgi:pilus assembly protein FimV